MRQGARSSQRQSYPLIVSEAFMRPLTLLDKALTLTQLEATQVGILKGGGATHKRPERAQLQSQSVKVVMAYWSAKPQAKPCRESVLPVAYLMTLIPHRALASGDVNVRVKSMERVTVKGTRVVKSGPRASVEPRPVEADADAPALRAELIEAIEAELARPATPSDPRLLKLLKAKRVRSEAKWAEGVFQCCDPDSQSLKEWLQLDSLSERYRMLGRLTSTHLLETSFFATVKQGVKEQFALGQRRQELNRRLRATKMMLQELSRHEQKLRQEVKQRHSSLIGELTKGDEQLEAKVDEGLIGERPAEVSEGDSAASAARSTRLKKPTWDPWASDDDDDDEGSLEERLSTIPFSVEAQREVKRSLKQLRSGGLMGPELHNTKSFLEVVAELPWERRSEAPPAELKKVEEALNQHHKGLGEVKERILEHLAVSQLSGAAQGSVLCLSGPPGVGKTSLVKQIAAALGRPFVRISLGGVEDEAAIRGHRRTYVSAMPGRICDALKQAKVKDPVILLDEVDKVGESQRGSPEAALLEVLDPEQNSAFRDHYLEIPLDLSEVLFISTVNDPRRLSAPLRDRLELVELTGYLDSEKQEIVSEHLLPRTLASHGLASDALRLSPELSQEIITRYTREAGVRQLERMIKRICRKLAKETVCVEEGAEAPKWELKLSQLTELLGPPQYREERALSFKEPGLACGLAWSALGGSVLHIETARYPGKGGLRLTGRLGEVMQESAQTALTALRVRRGEELIEAHDFSAQDLHIHFPEGATPKDGPSAGVTLYCALYSLMSARPLREDVAMSGECTLQGRVLPVGGLKEKLLAAQRGGIKRVILPRDNHDEVMAFEPEARGDLELIWVERADEALEAALSER